MTCRNIECANFDWRSYWYHLSEAIDALRKYRATLFDLAEVDTANGDRWTQQAEDENEEESELVVNASYAGYYAGSDDEERAAFIHEVYPGFEGDLTWMHEHTQPLPTEACEACDNNEQEG